jgi:tyrosyl-DNA phosphodiesterase-1
LTSANISKQAWGEAARATDEIRIASWEIGVLVWPELIEQDSIMISTFKTDMPENTQSTGEKDACKSIVGLRMPYNTPLQRYASEEIPWVASMSHTEPDWAGQTWI